MEMALSRGALVLGLAAAACGAGGGGTPAPSASGAGDVIVVAVGDIACGATRESCQEASTAALVDTIRPSLVLALGDLQYGPATYGDFQRYYGRSWGRFLAMTRAVPGNHDYNTAGAAGYFDYLDGPGRDDGAGGPRGKGYYGFDLAGWHVVALNSNCDAVGGCQDGSPQERWLRSDLAAHPGRCTLAMFHHPRFSSGPHGSQASLAGLWRDLADAGVDLALVGHDHLYERFAPLDRSGREDATRGVRELVVGTGGVSLYRFASVQPGSQVRYSGFGVMKLRLGESSYGWEFVPVDPRGSHDSGEAACH
jgi:3',5'-cyclic AMP phosphodiesterase CpdA